MLFEYISDDEEGSACDLSMSSKINNDDFEKVYSDILNDLLGGGVDLNKVFAEFEPAGTSAQQYTHLTPSSPPQPSPELDVSSFPLSPELDVSSIPMSPPPPPSSPASTVHNDHSYHSDEEAYIPSLTIRRLSEKAFPPHDHGPGVLLFSSEAADIFPMGRRQVNTDIGVCIPCGYYGEIISHEYMAYSTGLVVLNTCTTQNSDIPLKVSILNTGVYTATINIGDPIGVLVLKEVIKPKIVKLNF